VFDPFNFIDYAPVALKIKTKLRGLQLFTLRKYQLRYIQHLKDDFPDGIIRSISLKPRQAGWSTLIAGINMHAMGTRFNERGIMLADKFSRTSDVHGIYTTFVDNLPRPLLPMISANNSEEINFDNPNKDRRIQHPGLGSSIKSETAQDPNAGRSGTRMFAHLTEYAFYPYAASVDEGVQNSVPLGRGTRIFKESTANGMGGDGASFYEQYMAAERGDYIYKPFFVAWYEIDDYALPIPLGFRLNKEEIELVTRCPEITDANLVWRRMKISEYANDSKTSLSPQERFKQDFPSYPEEAFLSTGRPVFDTEKIKKQIEALRRDPAPVVKIKAIQKHLRMFEDLLTVYFVPEKGRKYFIGADVAEGLEIGDSSSAKIIDDDHREVAKFHGKIDADLYGRVLVELAKIYNLSLLVPEKNNMGHTTLNAIKDEGYLKVYMTVVEDELEKSKETVKLGWVTTVKSKQKMLNKFIQSFRDDEIKIMDIDLLREMMTVVREPNGDVVLNGKDRVVAACLALMGTTQNYEPAKVHDPNKKEKLLFETKDLSRERIMKREARK
jgi:hypothetical protein